MEDMVKRFGPVALQKSQFKLKVATLCSGTEAPIFALNMLLQYFKAINPHGVYEVEHIFSCEIEPFKQGFIYRNIPPGIILFRDAGEMATAAPNGEAVGNPPKSTEDFIKDLGSRVWKELRGLQSGGESARTFFADYQAHHSHSTKDGHPGKCPKRAMGNNVDRTEIYDPDVRGRVRHHLGIIGCITPSGMPVVTHLMRPITGTETLALQGLPIGELVLSTETEAELRDLAGNAMTVPVVGAVTLTLLEVVATLTVLLQQTRPASSNRELRLEIPRDEILEPGAVRTTTTRLAPLLAKVEAMVRRCYCQTRPGDIFVCRDCGATACSACRGNPSHRFGPKTATSLEFTPEEGKVQLNEMLPNALKLPVPAFIVNYALSSVKEPLYRSVVQDILDEEGNHVYYFDAIKVTEVVTVCYKASNSTAHLILAPEGPCHWYIYIAPWHPRRADLFRVSDLDQPIARGQLAKSGDICLPQWSVWAQGRIDLRLSFSNAENNNLVPSDLSFAPQYDGVPTPSLQEWKALVQAKVYGTYIHHPNCGTAGNRLHINQSSSPDNVVFMMWDSGLLRDPDEDHFVWTETTRRMEPHEYQEILLHAQPTLTWGLDYGIDKSMSVFWPGYWSRPSGCIDNLDFTSSSPSQDLGHIHWGFAQAIQQASCHTDGQAPIIHMPALAAITAAFNEFPGTETHLFKIDSHQTDNEFTIIPATRREPFLRTFAFLSNLLCRSTAPETLSLFPHLERKWVMIAPCPDCSMTPPEITVHTEQEQKNKQSKTIIEDPDEAALFERKYQDLPRAVAVAARFLQGGGGEVTMNMRLLFQPKTLASRALAYLFQAHRSIARGRNAVNSDAVTSFTVELDYASASMTGFAPFTTFVRPCSEDNTDGIDTTSEYELPNGGPPLMTKQGHHLRPSQKEAVDWMLRRERAPLDFVKSEVEEEIVSPLNLRVLGKAEWASRFPFSSRGGVIAHEIGYGKTVVTLALIDHMRDFDKKQSIDERREKVDAAWAEDLSGVFELRPLDYPTASFFCHLPATLVVVPKHITSQWMNEAKKFLGLDEPKLLLIDNQRAFYGRYSRERLEQAEIIIMSSAVFTSKAFLSDLQGVAGRSGDGLSGRTLEAWYRGALRNHRILTAHYLAGRAAGSSHDELTERTNDEILPALIKEQEADIAAVVKKQVSEINRRWYKKGGKGTGGAAGFADAGESEDDAGQKKKQRGASKGKEGRDAAKRSWDISWLHNFSFARIVWDECSCYEAGPIGLFVANAVANAKWPISATPKLFGLEEVCQMAAARPRLAHHRHDRAALFLGSHLRGNPMDPEINIRFREHVLPVEMTTSDSVRYHVVNQEVLDAGSDYPALPVHARDVVALRGSDLVGMDGSAAAKMLLGVLACGLGQREALTRPNDFADRSEKLSEQMKQLWDKMMWLWRWILPLYTRQIIQSKETPVDSTLNRVEAICGAMSKALDTGDFGDFGGIEMYQLEAAVIAGLPITEPETTTAADAQPNINSTRALVDKHFFGDWLKKYDVEKALHTWVDFFELEERDVKGLSERQLLLLAKDICWLKYKVMPDAPPFTGEARDVPLLEKTFAAESHRRTIPGDIAALAESDMAALAGLGKGELQEFIRVCIRAKPKPPRWEEAKRTFQLPDHGSKAVRLSLQEILTSHNVKYTSAHTVDNLKEKLWRHQNGLGIPDLYRDGRAPPDKFRPFSEATACGATKEAQVAAANEELKRTMVHLAKTVEDLRATRLEARFLPEYTSLANAQDADAVVRAKLCGGCSVPLTSASTSFLVVGCGHFLCSGCKSAAKSYCPVLDCWAFIYKRPVLRCSEVPPPPQGEPLAKADRVAELIANQIPAEDFVVVFAQYRLVIDALAAAFTAAGIQFLNLAAVGDDDISAMLEKFKLGKAGRVLLLDMDSETSAGSNLTIANHVVFTNPYVHHDQEHQARTVRQARGRCIRTPQDKEVQVYHFMTSGTIEEEMLRKYGKESPAVGAFFADFARPWWLGDEEE
ncbi:hypothetical protein CHGG_08700 [Chaetomium globosum CBS 148.51]|uniref:Helicase ATP-binding domain-containing protein n=1 Tax=Chaetomium globosum (strain ATCC 6205 / CBS 148.51 / DSM 1962 / NBRC 6347 / NRRL 1970) TaxID=306901 RepID=Q2GTK4_CHAGB|nr:uncharacterized protein CHGG_08700 [Chaetomium globosum CBS 148.51]EAQ84686.1 hypothetical protein CHGG_08700 [Chaetomium globosum CBS 148.51]